MASEPVIIQAAITGSVSSSEQNRKVPMATEQIVESALEAVEAGASVLHLHAREKDGTPTQDVERYREIYEGITEAGCPAVINLSTGSANGRAEGAERYECLELGPEMGSLDCGSVNFGERVFENSPSFLRDLAQAFLERGVRPEIECFEVGHIFNALELRNEGLLQDPMIFQFVLGVKGGSPGTIAQAVYMRSLIPENATWSICGIGRTQLPLNLHCLATDGHVRTGLEDNVYYLKGQPAVSNAQLVSRIVRIAGEIGRPIATPDQAREILSIG